MPGSKEKLDALLGISSDKSIDDVLADLDKDTETKLNETVQSIGEAVKESAKEIDEKVQEYSDNKEQLTSKEEQEIAQNIKKNLDNIDELVALSKNIIKHLYTNIVSTDLIDPEIIQAAASFIESTRANISEYLDIYKERQKFFEKIQFEAVKHQHNLEILERKYELEAKRNANANSGMLSGSAENLQVFDQTKLIRMLNDVETGN